MLDPERTLESRQVFQGRLIQVRVEQVGLPDGTTARREIVEHPGAVCIVAVDDQRNVLMVRQYRKAVGETLLEVPAGTLEPGERPLECAERELREETGFAARTFDLLGEFWTTPGFTTERMYAFLATALRPDALPADTDERIEVERVPLARAAEMARKGEIHDAKSIAALLMAEGSAGAAS